MKFRSFLRKVHGKNILNLLSPICDGVKPFLASLPMDSTISSVVAFCHCKTIPDEAVTPIPRRICVRNLLMVRNGDKAGLIGKFPFCKPKNCTINHPFKRWWFLLSFRQTRKRMSDVSKLEFSETGLGTSDNSMDPSPLTRARACEPC
jgi:hypothetical protein